MIFPFSEEQDAFLRKTFGIDPNTDMDDETQLRLEDMLSEHLQVYGINESGDGENITGRICADILAVIARNGG